MILTASSALSWSSMFDLLDFVKRSTWVSAVGVTLCLDNWILESHITFLLFFYLLSYIYFGLFFSKTRRHLRHQFDFCFTGHFGLIKDVNVSFFLSFYLLYESVSGKIQSPNGLLEAVASTIRVKQGCPVSLWSLYRWGITLHREIRGFRSILEGIYYEYYYMLMIVCWSLTLVEITKTSKYLKSILYGQWFIDMHG